MKEHLVFYDGDCSLCYKAVGRLLKLDEEKKFLFAPLEGETAREILIGPNAFYSKINSLVLVEDFQSDARQFWVRGQAVFRIYWLLGYRWLGWMYVLPSWMSNWVYTTIVKHRHRLHFGWERPEFHNDQFLP